MQQNCRQEKEEEEDTFKIKEEEETELLYKKLAFVKGNQNKNKVLNTLVKKKTKSQSATHVLYAKTTSIVLPKYRSPALSPSSSLLPCLLARWRQRTAHMRLNSSAQPRKGAPTAGLLLRSEAEVCGLAYPLSPDGSVSSSQHTDLHKTLDSSPTARCRTLCKKTTDQCNNPTK